MTSSSVFAAQGHIWNAGCLLASEAACLVDFARRGRLGVLMAVSLTSLRVALCSLSAASMKDPMVSAVAVIIPVSSFSKTLHISVSEPVDLRDQGGTRGRVAEGHDLLTWRNPFRHDSASDWVESRFGGVRLHDRDRI